MLHGELRLSTNALGGHMATGVGTSHQLRRIQRDEEIVNGTSLVLFLLTLQLFGSTDISLNQLCRQPAKPVPPSNKSLSRFFGTRGAHATIN